MELILASAACLVVGIELIAMSGLAGRELLLMAKTISGSDKE